MHNADKKITVLLFVCIIVIIFLGLLLMYTIPEANAQTRCEKGDIDSCRNCVGNKDYEKVVRDFCQYKIETVDKKRS